MDIKAHCLFPTLDHTPNVHEIHNRIAWKCQVHDDGTLEIGLNLVDRSFNRDWRRFWNWRHFLETNTLTISVPLASKNKLSVRWLGDGIIVTEGNTSLARLCAQEKSLRIDVCAPEGIHVGTQLPTTLPNPNRLEFISPDNTILGLALEKNTGSWHPGTLNTWQGTAPDKNKRLQCALSLRNDQDSALLEKDLNQALTWPLESWVNDAVNWLDGVPCPSLVGDQYKPLWEHAWLLHRVARMNPVGIHKRPWETVARFFYPNACLAAWDTIHMAYELLSYREDWALDLMDNYIGALEEMQRQGTLGSGASSGQIVCDTPQQPLWPGAVRAVYSKIPDRDFLQRAYEVSTWALGWLERHRRARDGELFTVVIKGGGNGGLGYDNSPVYGNRIDAENPTGFVGAVVELCSQMAGAYEDMAWMADSLDKPDDVALWTKKRERLVGAIRSKMWDPRDRFFYSLDDQNGQPVRIKHIACFWPLAMGVATDQQASDLVSHIQNTREFWTALPLATLAMNEPAHGNDMWRGPVWLSQNYWLAKGLIRYGYKPLAVKLARETLAGVDAIFQQTGKIFEFYHPHEPTLAGLTRKGSPSGPCPFYNGSQATLIGLIMLAEG